MSKIRQVNIRLDEELYQLVRLKCHRNFGIGIAPLIKMFLKAFITQKGVGFYVGDDDLCYLIHRWLSKKKMEQGLGKNNARFPTPRLKDLYSLNDVSEERRRICQKALHML